MEKQIIESLDQKLFKCNIDNSKSIEYNLKQITSCKCCPRHMTCRPEFYMMKILLDNKNKEEIKKIHELLDYDIICVGHESIKYVFSDSFFQITSFVCDNPEMSDEQYSKLQYMTQTIISYYEQLVTTFNCADDVSMLCKLFEYKIMNVLTDELFIKSTKKDKTERFENIFKWAIEIYEDLKSIGYMETHHNHESEKDNICKNKSENVCVCMCRMWLRKHVRSNICEEK